MKHVKTSALSAALIHLDTVSPWAIWAGGLAAALGALACNQVACITDTSAARWVTVGGIAFDGLWMLGILAVMAMALLVSNHRVRTKEGVKHRPVLTVNAGVAFISVLVLVVSVMAVFA